MHLAKCAMKNSTGVHFIWVLLIIAVLAPRSNGSDTVRVGALLDLGSPAGKASRSSITMALKDFRDRHGSGRTASVEMQYRDCKQGNVATASAAIDLLKNYQAQVLVGPMTSTQTEFVLDLGDHANVPVVSFTATSPALSSARSPFFVRTTVNDSSQVPALAALVAHFRWHEVVLVLEDSDFGTDIVPYLVNGLEGVDVRVPYSSVIATSASDDHITAELYKLMAMQTRVFVVHMMPDLAARLFSHARDAGMMEDGYVWIVTDSITNMLEQFDANVLGAMDGVIGVRPYVPPNNIESFAARFSSRFHMENPGSPPWRPTAIELRAYDTAWAIAMAVTKASGALNKSTWSPPHQIADNSTDLGRLGAMQGGRRLLHAIRSTTFRGLAGEFRPVDGYLEPSALAVVNVGENGYRTVGFWTAEHGLSRKLTAPSDGLKKIIWPGDVSVVPKGWQWPTAGKKLKIGVPVMTGFKEFINVSQKLDAGKVNVTGYCIDIFDAVMGMLPYAAPYEYVSMGSNLSYDEMVNQVHEKKYDGMVGATTILANRSLHIDFTLPYTESGVQMVVPLKDSRSKSLWVFLMPLKKDLWLAIFGLFFFTGFVVWLIEHRIHDSDLRADTCTQQLFNISYFKFYTFLTPPRERLKHNLSKFALINWMLVAWLLEKNYSASLTSIMTVRQLQPAISDLDELLKSRYYVGYQDKSFVKDLLKSHGFHEDRLKNYSDVSQYHEALKKGSSNGGVAAVFDGTPFLKLLVLGKYCGEYSAVGPIYKTGGFGFVFPKGSPLVPDVSRAILNVTEGEEFGKIEQKWFGESRDVVNCSSGRSSLNVGVLDFRSFRGVFYITFCLWGIALLVFVVDSVCKSITTRTVVKRRSTEKVVSLPHINHEPVVSNFGELEISWYKEEGPYMQHDSSSSEPSSTRERARICK